VAIVVKVEIDSSEESGGSLLERLEELRLEELEELEFVVRGNMRGTSDDRADEELEDRADERDLPLEEEWDERDLV
jgi:hypothetical protein